MACESETTHEIELNLTQGVLTLPIPDLSSSRHSVSLSVNNLERRQTHSPSSGTPYPASRHQTASGYADASRPGLLAQAQAICELGRQSWVVAFSPEKRQSAIDNIVDLVHQTPALKYSLEKLEGLFSRLGSQSNAIAQTRMPLSSIERLLEKSHFDAVRQNAYDDNAFLFNKGVSSEPEQMRLMKATIESADKFAAVTTYGIKPVDERTGKVTNTMHSVLAGLAQKQGDADFNFVFLYNKSVGIQNLATGGKRTQISLNPNSSRETLRPKDRQQQWPQVLNAYNKQIVEEYNKAVQNGSTPGPEADSARDLGHLPKETLQTLVKAGHLSALPIMDLKAKVYLVAADPGIAGSHHNKFAINDSGFAATLGASIGNTSKPSWFDSGAVSLSQKLASSQRDYLLNTLLPEGKHIGLLTCQDGQSGINAAIQSDKVKAFRQEIDTSIRGLEIKQPFKGDGDHHLNDHLQSGLRSSGFLKNDEVVRGHHAKVAWIQNRGTNLEPLNAKPIKEALRHMFMEAQAGDTILLRNNAFESTAQKLVKEALERGVNVKILAPTKTKLHDAAKLFKDIQKVASHPTQPGEGQLQIHVFNPSQAQRDAHDFDPGGRPVNDHAKVYALQRKDPQKASILLTGTHNLDGQSVKRSHENVMFIESKDRYLTESLFDEFWDSTPEMRKEDIDLLLTEFHKPRSLPKDDWAQMIQSKQALLEKMGLQDKPARN